MIKWLKSLFKKTEIEQVLTCRKTSKRGLDLIKEFEGCKLKAYLCPANIWTIGYGHTGLVKEGDRVTKKEATLLLKQDVAKFERGVNEKVKVPLSQNQFDALVSFTFNVGLGAFSKSTLLKKLNALDYNGATNEFKRWNKGNRRILVGLTRRRLAEENMFRGINGRY